MKSSLALGSFEQLIEEANKRGLVLANLFQVATNYPSNPNIPPIKYMNQWQANLRNERGWYDYGRGDSPVAALQDALDRATGTAPENRPIPKDRPVKNLEEVDPFS